MGYMRNAFRSLVGNSEEKRSLRRLRHSWKYNIKMNFWKIGWEGRVLDLSGAG
jgi:hypothetical protein